MFHWACLNCSPSTCLPQQAVFEHLIMGQGAHGSVGFSGYGDQRDMEQVWLIGCRVYKHPTLQSLPLQSRLT